MADFYTQGSFILKLNNIEQAFAMSVIDCVQDEEIDLTKTHKTVAAKAYDAEVYRAAKKLASTIDDYEFREYCLGFDIAQETEGLWFSDWDCFNGYNAANFIHIVLKHFDKPDIVCFELAHTCSKLRLDSFSGEAWCITKKTIRNMNTGQWLSQQIKRNQKNNCDRKAA